MTDNRTTELLRKGLTEHGIEWRSGLKGVTFVGDWCFVEYDNGKLAATCEPVLTPEQAIAATLGVGECAQCAKDMGAYADSLCDPLKERINKLLRCLEHDWNISASWDGLRKFWNIELTEEGVKLRDATHGTLTAEQIEKAIHDCSTYASYDGCTYYASGIRLQAIADELNAELGSGTCEMFKRMFLPMWTCSECGKSNGGIYGATEYEPPKVCPNCGARVEGGA